MVLNPSRRSTHAADRGATLVEYAMAVALVCVVSLGAISFLERESDEELTERSARVGSPDLEAGLPGGGSTGGSTGGSSGGSTDGTPGAAPSVVSVASQSSSASKSGNDWDATVEVTFQGDGAPMDGIEVSGTWTLYENGTALAPEPIDPPCVTSASGGGECTFTRDDMEARTGPGKQTITKAVFTVTGYRYVGEDPATTYTIPPAPALTIEIERP